MRQASERLAKAQLKLGDQKAAVATLGKLLAKEWPDRFGDVHREAGKMLAAAKREEEPD